MWKKFLLLFLNFYFQSNFKTYFLFFCPKEIMQNYFPMFSLDPVSWFLLLSLYLFLQKWPFLPSLFLCLFFTFFFSPPKASCISQLISVSFITYLVHYILLTLGKYYQKPRTREINGLDKDYKKMGQERLPSKKFLSVDFLELQYRLGIAKPTYLLLFCLELPKNLTM